MIRYCLLMVVTLCSAQPNLDSAVRDYIHNELLFSHTSVVKGRKGAFLEFLSDSCVMFNPIPVNGKDLFRSLPERGGYLTWKPTFVEISSGGDFCYAYGPWEFRLRTLADEPSGYGHFFSVWEKEGGVWKVTLDNGISYDRNGVQNEELRIVTPERTTAGRVYNEAEQRALADAENRFATTVSERTTQHAYKFFASKNITLFRDGRSPVNERRDVIVTISKESKRMQMYSYGAKVSPAGDLGFTYGLAVDAQNDSCSYVRMWRKEEGWKIAVDIMKSFK